MHKVIKAVLILVVVSLLVAFVRESQLNQQKLELKQIEVKDTSLELKKLNEKYNQELERSNVNQQTIEQLQKEKEELNKQLQAKKEQQAKLAQKRVGSGNVAYAAPVQSSGGCEDWMRQAGIPITSATKTLIINESGCRYNAVNPTSGACGIPQALPCSKLPCTLDQAGAVCQLRWMDSYVKQRYTTWDNALSFWHCIGRCTNNYGTITKYNNWY